MKQWLFAALCVLAASPAFAHIRVYPNESVAGAREKYVVRVPNEKQVNTIRVEGEFPAGLDVYDFEFKPGWKLDFKKDAQGKIIGATWTGTALPYEFVEFGLLALNPKQAQSLKWKFTQFYADGMTEEFSGPIDSRLPALVVTLRAP